ncbi:kinase-like protein [Sparassis crispa]|uniref:non-specific serine/threonine protein kinase n=1 Tax=Sparassis crispa TaxID=139825 RepID=A0A401GQU8_9APHY|nr:kinase-like protein [Sparassis crispa]GBE84540.1 kinase-like protein [Sparassis crispa]
MSSPDDFQFGEVLGEGSWSMVVKAVHARSGKVFAVKIVSKAFLKKEDMVSHAMAERDALLKLFRGRGGPPGFVRLYSTFQDLTSLYYVMSLAPNGDFKDLVKKCGSLSLDCARYYTAQILDAVQWMHAQGVIHRDLKPENILLDEYLRIKLADFGSAYVMDPGNLGLRKSTFVGTAAYISPEMLLHNTSGKSTDIWAIGSILYYLLLGRPPFLAPTEYLTFMKVKSLDFVFPESGFDADAKDVIYHILVLEPSDRLGVDPKSSPTALRKHPFFVGHNSGLPHSQAYFVDWSTLWTIDPIEIKSGLVPPPSPQPEEITQEFWDTFVHEFSLVAVDDGSGENSDSEA